ncbi:D-glycero-beta-D-manno-heptose 1,7-bisphosphate 7-phosphatase [Candidatus Pseudothioglobus singularis]|uniref:D,D-heptose 1,7-bisphosphate phosphatase n=1 Tax=Candidatus Pseudothioglobus singularis PS1 TaxID=1125411 RepID=A0A0M4LE75_9GAMM|nr:D-glycero-beta-D-manno-heptose 1,7-bisphosphate 7-phosphatase [Candidatus Pseudothioglobus singularis]ALE02319.1 D,D-heptose 1,7-bisphosphate phosphatase [Candidatus Pseudothioglobus singularis PS1]
MATKAIFLDRDGVINKEINYLYRIEDFQFINGIFEACQFLESLNYKIIVITNQSGISRGYYTEIDFQKITKWMLDQFYKNNIEILDVIHCPHLPSDCCVCRKPKPGMLLSAKSKHSIDMEKSWMIGDKEEDIMAANAVNIKNTILVRSGHKINEKITKAKFVIDSLKESKYVINK